MKFTSFWAIYLPIALAGFTGCAKKPHEEGREVVETKIQPVVTSEIPKCLEEIRDAITLKQPERIRGTISRTIEFQPSDLNKIFDDGETLLTYAIIMDSPGARDLLITLGADINVANASGETPLIMAAKMNRPAALDKLIIEKARLDDKDNKGNTALLWTLQNNQEAQARLLISSGANVEITNEENRNASSYAHEKKMVDVLKVLSTRMQVNYGAADASSFISVLTSGDALTLDKMISESSSIVTDYEDVNPLVLILQVEDPNTASGMAITLLENGANINGPKDAKITPLIRASEIQNIDFVRFFLNSRANVNAVDADGKSALIHAVEKNNYDIVNVLIRSYADKKYSYKDKEGKKKSYSACNVVKATYSTLDNTNDLVINEKIKNRLGCTSFLWF